MIKNFLFQKLKCSSSRYFYQVLWQFLSSGFWFGIFGQILAACGGEMRPNYFKNTPPDRKMQARGSRLALRGKNCQRTWANKIRRNVVNN